MFASARDGLGDVYITRADGAGEIERLGIRNGTPFGWTSGGEGLVCRVRNGIGIWHMTRRTMGPLVEIPKPIGEMRVSPDRRWLAYESTGRDQAPSA